MTPSMNTVLGPFHKGANHHGYRPDVFLHQHSSQLGVKISDTTSLGVYQWNPLIRDPPEFLLPNVCSILCCADTLKHKELEKLPFVKGLQAITSFSGTCDRQHS